MVQLVSSMLLRIPSIQPKQSSISTASGHVMLGLPEPFLWKPTQSSVFRAWCFSSHARSFDGESKNTGFIVANRYPIAPPSGSGILPNN